MNKQMTVNDLFELCKKAIRKGHGNKNIVLSDDNEGNGYHGMFYGFAEVTEGFEYEIYDSVTNSARDTIILG